MTRASHTTQKPPRAATVSAKSTGKHAVASNGTKGNAAKAPSKGNGHAAPLETDRGELETFIRLMFRHATIDTWATPRGFCDNGKVLTRWARIAPDLRKLIDVAFFVARQGDTAGPAVVFSPPIATFTNNKHAAEADLAEGLAISVECDKHAQKARAQLEAIIGPATCVVASGGQWSNPETGKLEPKLHLHWRLKVPARTPDEHAMLKTARQFAHAIVDADPTNVPIVHPIRWPGSWHRKNEPHPCHIVAQGQHEIDLDEAFALLQAAQISDQTSDQTNFWEQFGLNQPERIDLEELLRNCVYYGIGKGGNLHITRLRYSAALLARGTPVNDVIEQMLDLTRQFTSHENWSEKEWKEERKKIEGQCTSFLKKFPQYAPALNAASKVWPTLHADALYGLAGKVVQTIAPHTESDPVALLLQFLTSFGNMLGRGPYFMVEGDQHFTNLFVVLVGESSKSRKGTSAGRIRQLMTSANLVWVEDCIKGGLSSGEGVVWEIRDKVTKVDEDGNERLVVDGVDEKRLLLDEREFYQALTVMKREGNIVSRTVRDAWDGHPLMIMTKSSPARCVKPHISIVGHITEEELRRTLDHTSMANGYANRFMWACVRRARFLPFGGSLKQSEIEALGEEIRSLDLKWTAVEKEISMDVDARKLWAREYHDLSTGQLGLLGAITGRAEAQTVRLALLYALLDYSEQIREVHLKAALALWRYCEDSARHIFGDSLGDPFTDELLRALHNSGGMTRTQIRDHFGRNKSSEKIDAALADLKRYGKAKCEKQTKGGIRGGPQAEIWRPVVS